VSEQPNPGVDAGAVAATCAQCSKALTPEDRVAAGDRQFCRTCYESLRAELEQVAAAQSSDIPYLNATLGAVLGGMAGVLAWWGFTVLTRWSVGLLAVAIGFLVGHGAVRFSGGKRSRGLQLLSIGVALVSYVCATYLVNMTFINQGLAKQGDALRIGFPPQTLELLLMVVTTGFGAMDLVFLAIVVYEAWKIPRPLMLPPNAAA